MDDVRKQISKVTLALQSQTDVPLWALANEMVIYAIALGTQPKWGRSSTVLRHLVGIINKFGLADVAIFLVGFIRILSLWKKTRKNKTPPKGFKKIFAGFGAAPEEHFYQDFIKRSNDPILRINWVTGIGMEKFGFSDLKSIILLLIKHVFGHSNKLKKAASEVVQSNIEDFLTVGALNSGSYAFFRYYWHKAALSGVSEVSFVAPDLPAISCIDENLPAVFLQHGLLALSILIPKFKRIEVLTWDEEKYFLTSHLKTEILKVIHCKKNGVKKNTIIVLSPNIFSPETFKECQSLLDLIKKEGWEIVLRPTPRASHQELEKLRKEFPDAVLDDLTSPIQHSFAIWQPKLVAGWWSTGLAIALEHGCLPINICNLESQDLSCNMIYAMKKRALLWPRDTSLLMNILQSESHYELLRQDYCADHSW